MKKKLQFLKNLMIGMMLILCGSNLHAQCPTIFNVTGGGARCSNGAGLGIVLSGSQTGVKYQLFRDGNANVILNGTNLPLSIVTTLAGTYTIVATNTASSCQMTMSGSATITINPTPNFSFTTTDVSCAGSDGSITATGTGGTPGYLFNIDGGPFSGSNVFTGVSAGNHSVAIQDANSCSVTKTIPIQGASPLSVEISGVNPGDCSGANGSITANRIGGIDDGITPVQFKLDGTETRGYQNSNVFGGLSKGDYTVTVKDSKGCTAVSSTVSLTQVAGTAPTAFDVTGGGARCSDGAPVSINLSGSETGVNYQLSNNGSPVGSSISGTGSPINFSVTDSGSYTIVATNATAGCTNIMNGTATVVVNPAPNLFTVTGGGARCSNGSGLGIFLSSSQTGVKYRVYRDGNPTSSSLNGTGHSISFLTSIAGTYTMIATNATSGCTSNMIGSAIVVVNAPLTLFNVTGGGTRCYDAAGIAVGLSGSQAGVNYQLQNGGSPVGAPTAGTGSALSFQAVDPGTYTVVATNATTNCISNMTGSVNVSVNPQLTPSYTKYYASSCVGGDGTITVTGNGGTSPYLYNVDNGPFSSDNFITGLAAGDHRVEVKDANSCSFVYAGITILTAPLMKVNTIRVQPSSCSGNDGSIQAFPYGGVVDGITPLEYQLDGAATVPFQLSNTFTGLMAGTYTITIKDSKGCLADTTVTLSNAAELTFKSNSYNTNVSSCGNGMDARISVSIMGGQPPFHYSLDGTEIGQSYSTSFGFTNVGVGTHTVTVTDIHGTCSASQDFTVDQATPPIAKVIYKGNETCIGKNNGYITLSPTGIGGVPGYMFSKDGGSTYQGSMSFTNLSPGAYSMVVKDSKGCTSDAVSVTINAGTVACPPIAEKDNSNLMTASGLSDGISLNPSLIVQAYPNPFASDFVLNVKGNNREQIGIIVTDVLGRKLFEQKGNANQQYNLGRSLKTGIYLIKVIQGNNVQTIKIVKE